MQRFILRVSYSAGTNFCGSRSIRKIRKNKNPQNFHATRYLFFIAEAMHVLSFRYVTTDSFLAQINVDNQNQPLSRMKCLLSFESHLGPLRCLASSCHLIVESDCLV